MADGTGVFFVYFVFFLVHPVYFKFWCATIVNREMKSVSAILFMIKLMAM